MLLRLDRQALLLIEKFSHWFQRLTGITNFWWSNACLATFCFGGVFFIPLPQDLQASLGIKILIFWGCLVPLAETLMLTFALHDGIRLAQLLEEYYQACPTSAHKASLNIREGEWVSTRELIVVATLVVVIIYFIFAAPYVKIHSMKLVALTTQPLLLIHVYFLGVIPLPPGKSKIGQWIEEFNAGFKKLVPIKNK